MSGVGGTAAGGPEVGPELALREVSVVLGGRTVLRGIDLVLPPGQLTALIGPNGAGKSTLLGVLAGDLVPAVGEASLDGRPMARWSSRELARRRAVLPQKPGVGFSFTVRQVVEMGRHAHRARRLGGDRTLGARTGPAGRVTTTDVVERSLGAVGLTGFAERSVGTLSGGEAARVHLARVLAQGAPILLLDEPTAALDLRHQHLVVGIARRHAAAGGTAVVVLHDLNLAAAYADRIVLLADGAVLADGTAAAVLTPRLVATAYGHPVEILCHPRQRWKVVVADRIDPPGAERRSVDPATDVVRGDTGDACPPPPPTVMAPWGGPAGERTEDHGPACPT